MPDKDLLPCPFCGGKAEFVCEEDFYLWYRVECTKCKAKGKSVPLSITEDTLAKAAALWNNRTRCEKCETTS